jgi:8-oxo-(d)GTP phosphatase
MLLLRHASAGERLAMPEHDAARTLDRVGRAQAVRLPDALSGFPIGRIVSSPLARSVETVAPLARRLGLDVELREELEPGASKRRVLRLLRDLPDDALVCMHREVFETLFSDEVTCEKGAAWLVERRGQRFAPVAYLPAPALRRARRDAVLVPGCL